jgi:hypothetical protein
MFLAIGLGVAAVALTKILENEAGQAHRDWTEKYDQTLAQVNRQRHDLARHEGASLAQLDWKMLHQMRHAAIQVADQAHALLQQERQMHAPISQGLLRAKQRIEACKQQRQACRNAAERKALTAEIADLYQWRTRLFQEQDVIKARKAELLEEVRRLNAETHRIKVAIEARRKPQWNDDMAPPWPGMVMVPLRRHRKVKKVMHLSQLFDF